MPNWDIDPAGVHGVLGATQAAATAFDTHTTALGTGLDGAAAQAGSSIVSGALTGFSAARTRDLGFVVTRTGACLGAAAAATDAYLVGDLEMAANAQAAAAAAPDPAAVMPGRGNPMTRNAP